MNNIVNSLNNSLNDIFLITIIPKNSISVYYYINENKEKRSKKIKEMYSFIFDLLIKKYFDDFEIKKITKDIYNYLWSFKSFMFDFNQKEIILLKFNNEKEKKDMEENYIKKSTDIDNKIVQQVLSKNNKIDIYKQDSIYSKFWRRT